MRNEGIVCKKLVGVWERTGGGVKRFPSYGLLTCGRIASPASGAPLIHAVASVTYENTKPNYGFSIYCKKYLLVQTNLK